MNGPLRIRQRPQSTSLSIGADPAQTATYDEFLSRLLKLIPTEVISLYVVGRGFIPAEHPVILMIWTLIGLLAVVVVRAHATRSADAGPQWPAVGIAAFSFAIWVYSLGDIFAVYGLHVPWVGSLLVLVWTFFLPYIYKGDEL